MGVRRVAAGLVAWSAAAVLGGAFLIAACDDATTSELPGVGGDAAEGSGGMMAGPGSGGVGGDLLTGGFGPGSGGSGGIGNAAPQFAELWYSVADRLVHIPLNDDGSVNGVTTSTITNPPPTGQNLLTMMKDGSLIGGRHDATANETVFYHVPLPPRDGSDVTLVELGTMPNNLVVEALYTDCDGRLYGMDTGTDATSADGNRLLRFTGDFLGGDFAFDVVSDLSTADVADIDDMSPGIDNNEITDNPGLAIDTGMVHAFNYETGSGTQVGAGGTWGIHALGGSLFGDGQSRLYLLDIDAQLFEMDPTSFTVSPVLATGPIDVDGALGHSGLAGPLTDCDSGFTPPR